MKASERAKITSKRASWSDIYPRLVEEGIHIAYPKGLFFGKILYLSKCRCCWQTAQTGKKKQTTDGKLPGNGVHH